MQTMLGTMLFAGLRVGNGRTKPRDSWQRPGGLSCKILESNKNILYVQIRFL